MVSCFSFTSRFCTSLQYSYYSLTNLSNICKKNQKLKQWFVAIAQKIRHPLTAQMSEVSSTEFGVTPNPETPHRVNTVKSEVGFL